MSAFWHAEGRRKGISWLGILATGGDGRIHSRRRLEHGDKVKCDVCEASSTDNGTADVKDSVVAIQPVSYGLQSDYLGTHFNIKTPRSR
jgi:hypothetical protein